MANTAAALSFGTQLGTASNLHVIRERTRDVTLFIPAFKQLFGNGLRRGEIVEIYGRPASGKTAACLHVLAQCTVAGEICAVVDLAGRFDPLSAANAGVQLKQLLWVRCNGNSEHAMKAADLLLHAGGFGAVLLDISDAPLKVLNRIPISYWFRFRRAIESTPTVLIVCSQYPQARSCAFNSMELESKSITWTRKGRLALLRGLHTQAALKEPKGIRKNLFTIPAAA